jgi:hypothetical protein
MNTYHIKCQPLEMRVGEADLHRRFDRAAIPTEVSAKVKSAIEALYSAPRTRTT